MYQGAKRTLVRVLRGGSGGGGPPRPTGQMGTAKLQGTVLRFKGNVRDSWLYIHAPGFAFMLVHFSNDHIRFDICFSVCHVL